MRRILASVITVAFLVAAVVISPAQSSPSWAVPDYPSASEVAAAKRKVAEKKAMIARLQKIIEDLTNQAEILAKKAQIKAETYNQARDAVAAVQVKVNSLQAQANVATKAAAQAETELGQLAAQMYREGTAGTTVSLLLQAGKADDLLYKLGTQEKVAGKTNEIYQRSVSLQKQAKGLTAELRAAKTELAGKAKVAQSAFADAKAAASAAAGRVAANERLNRTFYAQLATLRDTSAALEREREEGLARERAQQAGSANLDAPELYSVGAPDAAKVQTAINFGSQQLGERYVLGGMGPDIWDCSGLTKASYKAAGIYIGTHSATNQVRTMAAARKLVPLKQMQVGDLIWWTQSSNFDGDKYHVAIFVGDGMMLESPNPARTVRIVPIRWGEMFPYAGRPTAD